MQKRRLGAGGPEVSAIGVGAMSFAGVYGQTTEEEAHALLAAALDLGIDHIDTSNIYGWGLSESMIGSFLARQGKAREGRFRIATKAAIRRDPATGRRFFDNSAGHLAAELEGSLERLGLEAVDLFYVHRRDPEVPIEEVAEALAGLVRAGKARAIGFSEVAPSSLRRAAAVHPVAAVQSEYSLCTRAPELGLVQACAGARDRARRLLAGGPRAPDRRAAHPRAHRRLGVPARQPALHRAEPLGQPRAHRCVPGARGRDGHQRRRARHRLAA